MNPDPLCNWRRVRVLSAATGTRLDIAHGPEGKPCVDAMVAYHEGRLAGLEPIRSSPATQVQRGRLLASGPVCYLKRFLMRDWRDPFKHLVFPSRAQRALVAGLQIERLGFHTPRPLCLLEVRRRGLILESVLVTEEVAGATHVFGWLNWPEWGVAGRADRKRELIRALGLEAGRWHAAGLCHGDMRLGNILGTHSPAGYTWYWLDNERTRQHRQLPDRLRIRNLVQLNVNRQGVTQTDRWRFWRAYLETGALPADGQRRILQVVSRRTEARRSQSGRS